MWRKRMIMAQRRTEIGMPPSNEIWYISNDGQIVEPMVQDFGAMYIDSIIEDGIGKMRFDGVVTSVGYYALGGRSNLAQIYFPEGLTYIGSQALAACSNLYKVVFPSTLASMGSNVLSGTDVTRLECHAVTPPTLSGALKDYGFNIYVPIGSGEAYQAAAYWEDNHIYEKQF